jgi:hypothetical protein
MSESGQLLSVYWTEKLEAERKDDAAATVDDDAATQRETLLREIIDRQDTELTRRDEIIREQQRIISGMATSLQSVGDGLREVKALSVPAPTFRERRFLWWRWYEPVETGSGR